MKAFCDINKKKEELILRLVNGGGDSLILQAVDKHGGRRHAGDILKINSNGITIYSNVNPVFGLPLEHDGKVKINKLH